MTASNWHHVRANLMVEENHVLLKNAVLWDVTQFGSCKNRRFRGMYGLHPHGENNR
jgi:hypothetical protein